jgi:hypothetical protein
MPDNRFHGRPIEGEINRYTNGTPVQADPQVLLNALDELLAIPGVEAVRWQQYTPYFNDGEACEFGVGEPLVKLAGDDENEDGWEYSEGYRSGYELYDYPNGYSRGAQTVNIEVPGVDVQAVRDGLKAFSSVIESGAHDVILNDKFGDPSEVTATTAGFSVEFYTHD